MKSFLRRRIGGLWYVAVEGDQFLGGVKFFWFPSFQEAWEFVWR